MADIKLIVDTKSVDRAIDKIDRLRTGVGRTSATTKDYTQTTQRSTSATQRHTGAVKSNTGAMATQAMATQRATKSTKQFGSIALQQVGYQVSDFTVQVQGGTSAMVAFGQQGSQLAGLLFYVLPGAIGAAVAAVVSIAIPAFTAFGNVLLNLGDNSKKLEDVIKELDQAFSSLDNANVLEYFGKLNSQVDISINKFRGLLELQQKVAREQRAEAFTGLISQFAPSEEINNLQTEINRLSELARETGVETNDTIERLNQKLSDQKALRSALLGIQGKTREETAENLSQVIDTLNAQELLSPELRTQLNLLADQLGLYVSAANKVEEVKDNTTDAKKEAEKLRDIAASIDFTGATAGANALADMLGVSADKAVKLYRTLNQLAGIKVSKKGAGRLTPFGTPDTGTFGGFTGAGGGLEFSGDFGPNVDDFISSGGTTGGSSGGSGGGGGMSAAEKQAQEFDKARKALSGLVSKYDEGVERAERLRDAQNTVNEAINAGVISADQGQQVMSDYIDSLKDAENPMQKIADTMRSSLGDAFMSIVDGSKSAGDAFKDMARLVLKQAFELLVIKPILDSLFGGGSGGGGGNFLTALFSANGNAFEKGGKVTAYANGGVVTAPTGFQHSGGLGVMGEAGPEAIMPLKRGKNGKLGVQSEGGSQQPIVINQSFNFAANGDDSVKRIIAQEAPKIANLTQKQILDQRARGGAFKTTFG